MIPPPSSPPPPYISIQSPFIHPPTPEMSFSGGRGFDSSSGYHQPSQSPSSSVLLAFQMYDRLRRMSDERKLNLSEEDVLISAYLGPNLVYRGTSGSGSDPATSSSLSSSSVYGPLHVQTNAL